MCETDSATMKPLYNGHPDNVFIADNSLQRTLFSGTDEMKVKLS